ncbi:MAG: L-lactate dehydrogenase [Burkholderiaceae bacterium]|nr:L-lactate dehydrogenase [Burkholderiaceae bacterium]
MLQPVTVEDYRELARQRLPHWLFEYIDAGAIREETLAANTADFQRLRLRQRVMRDVSQVTTATTLFGQDLALPLVLGPVGFAGMFARRGEVPAARAAARAGLPFCLSSVSICGIEEVAQAAPPPWFQLYMIKDRAYMKTLLGRAARLGCPVLVFTVDLPVPSRRYRNIHSGMGLWGLRRKVVLGAAALKRPRWLWEVMLRGRPHAFGNFAEGIPEARTLEGFDVWVEKNYEPCLDWDTLAWVREQWRGPMVIKGILDPDDARLAVQAGADGILVSNHGGRQLDGTCSSIAALPAVVDAVGARVPVLLDGGIRSGVDILKALALGARACVVGRAWAWGLAGRGERGVAAVIDTLERELATTMALAGCTDVGRLDRSVLLE